EDSSDCFGRALGGLFAMHDSHGGCTSHYDKLVETRLAGGWQLIVVVALLLVWSLLVYRSPRRAYAVLWLPWSGVVAIAFMFVTFRLDLFAHVDVLWPERVVDVLVGTLLVTTAIIAPIVALVSARTPRDDAPTARVV